AGPAGRAESGLSERVRLPRPSLRPPPGCWKPDAPEIVQLCYCGNKKTSWKAGHRMVWPPAMPWPLTQEVFAMLVPHAPARNPSSRAGRFLPPAWRDDHPEFRRIDASLPEDHHARWLACVVSRLDLSALRLSYNPYAPLPSPVAPLLAFLLFMYSRGILCPAQWAEQARYDDQSKWLLRGLRPSRSLLYCFRDRAEPSLDDWHKQLIAWAVLEGVTAASRGSLDGTFVAALASRHQLMSGRRLDRRLA